MTKPRTLNELGDLKAVGFGKPSPRHGLKLLYWFAHECVYFDNNNQMCWIYNPKEGYFGFKLYRNRSGLLPASNLKYYEMGNLREAQGLKYYVRDEYNQNRDECDSNKDRIMVSVRDEWLDEVYVTEHNHCRNDFNKSATYLISRGLIMLIKQLTLQDFLSKTGYSKERETPVWRNENTIVEMGSQNSEGNRVEVDDSRENCTKPQSRWWCTIL